MLRPHAALSFVCFVGACSGPSPGWHDGVSLPEPRFEAAAATVNGRIYYVGGITGIVGDMASAEPSSEVDIFDPGTQSWSAAPALPVDAPKHHLSLAVYQDHLYVLGGFDGIIGTGNPNDAFRPIPTTWRLDADGWHRLADAPLARGAATAQVLGTEIYVAGGTTDEGVAPFPDLYAYDPASDTWARRSPMNVAREHLASCAIDGKMIVVGGWVGAERTAMATAERYDPITDSWEELPSMPTARGGLGAVALGNTCHVVGGEDWALPLPGTYATQESFDTSTGQWSTLAPMQLARHGIGITVLNGWIFVIGGGPQQGNSYTDRVEYFVPTAPTS